MKADALSVSQLFQIERQLFAPLFQRPYVWTKDAQWEPLWEDVRHMAEKLLMAGNDEKAQQGVKPHFLGAVVLDQLRVASSAPDARLIIDGQQRLTTLQILMESLRDHLAGKPEHEKAQKRLEKLIYNELYEGEQRFKVWPTNTDRAIYGAVMACGSPQELDAALKHIDNGRDSRLAGAYSFFYEVIGMWLAADPSNEKSRIEALIQCLWSKLRLVVIDMDDQDDAQVIFETLNARGTPLLPSDLVKNFLFREALDQLKPSEIEGLHHQYWYPFERDDKFWRVDVGRGHAKRPRIDVFLQHYLTLGMNDEVPTNGLFDEFKRYYSAVHTRGVAWHLQELRAYADQYKRLQEVESQWTEEGWFLIVYTPWR